MSITLVVDVEQRRPACVLLQALHGCNSSLVTELFDGACWLTQPTPGMRRVTGTREQWEQFAREANRNRNKRWRKPAPATDEARP